MTDVAKLAGVSAMTVSRVLNEHESVAEETRQRVLGAMHQLRYQPNEVAQSLRKRRSRQIGVLVPYLFDPFFAVCAHAISTVAKVKGYSVVLSTSNEDQTSEFDEVNRMLRRNVEGLIVVPARERSGGSLLAGQMFEHTPIVTLDRPVEGSRFDSCLVENERGSKMGTEHLLQLGQRRIAYIGFADDLYTMAERKKGYIAAMTQAGLAPEIALLSDVLDDTLSTIRNLLSRSAAPTAFFCANNLVTRHVLHSMKTLGLQPPAPVAVVGFDDFETADLLQPGITVVRQPAEQLARGAAEVLFGQLGDERNAGTGRRWIQPVELVVRGSCGARPGPSPDYV